MTAPDWLTVGAQVAEAKQGYTFTTVKRITATMVVLDNGSKYRLTDMGKIGEKKGPYYGADRPTRLVSAESAKRDTSNSVVQWATHEVEKIGRVWRGSATEALDAMQAAIDTARQKLADIDATEGA